MDITLQHAREVYFSAGGQESQLGPRGDASWYWRRAALLLADRLASMERRRDRVFAWCRDQGCHCEPESSGAHLDACPGVAEEILKGAHYPRPAP